MKDCYFLAGMLIGVCVGGLVVYKSKMAKKTLCKCEEDIIDTIKETKEKINNKQEKKAN